MNRLLNCWIVLMLAGLVAGCGGSPNESADPELAAHLAQLDAEPLPAGVNAQVWDQLRASLRAALAGSRALSAAPVGWASSAALNLNLATGEFTWLYACIGDYDQNGEVNLADLTPLGMNFLETSHAARFPLSAALSVVDGDRNGEVNVADVSPLGQNYLSTVGGYRLMASSSFSDYPFPAGPPANGAPDGPEASEVAATWFSAALSLPHQDRLSFSTSLAGGQPGLFYWVRPVDGAVPAPRAT